jgi:glycosyltransferase A (GT-A) superfamily protein (DUF2064 family)
MKHAVCVFVKTPELSPVKTRLAKSIGEKEAIAFYEKAVLATEKVLLQLKKEVSELDIIWALAEKDALYHPRWSGKITVWQGDGDLGARLNHVETWAFKKYQSVLFYGADSPHVSEKILSAAYLILEKDKIIIGPCEDGGFYFLLTSDPLGSDVWTKTTYSQSSTLKELKTQILAKHNSFQILECQKNFDVDTVEEYERLCVLDPTFKV